MATISKFYLHNTAWSGTGTPPGTAATVSATTPTKYGASMANKAMNETIGSSQTSAVLTTNAGTTAQSGVIMRWISDPIAAQTISSQSVQCAAAFSEAQGNSNFFPDGVLAVWRPSTGALVGRILDLAGVFGSGEAPTTENASAFTKTSTQVVAQDGDVLVFEVWRSSAAQGGAGSAWANTVYFDGTTENSASSNAAFLSFTTAITMYDPNATVSGLASVAAAVAVSAATPSASSAISAIVVQTGIGPSVSNDYESSIGTAYVSTGALSQSTDVADSGTHSMKFVPSNGTTPIVWLRGGASQVASQGMAAQQGQTVTFTVKMRRDAAQNDVSWSLSLQFYDSGGSYVAGGGGVGAVISSSGFSVKTISYPITDSGVAWVLPRVVAGGALNTSPVYFDDLSLSILGSVPTPTVSASTLIGAPFNANPTFRGSATAVGSRVSGSSYTVTLDAVNGWSGAAPSIGDLIVVAFAQSTASGVAAPTGFTELAIKGSAPYREMTYRGVYDGSSTLVFTVYASITSWAGLVAFAFSNGVSLEQSSSANSLAWSTSLTPTTPATSGLTRSDDALLTIVMATDDTASPVTTLDAAFSSSTSKTYIEVPFYGSLTVGRLNLSSSDAIPAGKWTHSIDRLTAHGSYSNAIVNVAVMTGPPLFPFSTVSAVTAIPLPSVSAIDILDATVPNTVTPVVSTSAIPEAVIPVMAQTVTATSAVPRAVLPVIATTVAAVASVTTERPAISIRQPVRARSFVALDTYDSNVGTAWSEGFIEWPLTWSSAGGYGDSGGSLLLTRASGSSNGTFVVARGTSDAGYASSTPVNPGQKVRVHAVTRHNTAGVSAAIGIRYYRSWGTKLSDDTSSITAPIAGIWNSYSYLSTVPAGAAYAVAIYAPNNFAAIGTTINIDSLMLSFGPVLAPSIPVFPISVAAVATVRDAHPNINVDKVVAAAAVPLPTVTTETPDATVTPDVVQAVATPIRPAFNVAITATPITVTPGYLNYTFDSTIEGAHADPYITSYHVLSWIGTEGHTQAGAVLAEHTASYSMYVAFLPVGAASYADWSQVSYGHSYPITLWAKGREFGTSFQCWVREYDSSGTQLNVATLTTGTLSSVSWTSLGGTYTPSSSNVRYAYVTVIILGLNPYDNWGFYFDDFSGFGTSATAIPAPSIMPGPASVSAVATLPTPTVTIASAIDLRTPSTISFVNYSYVDDPMGYAEIGVPTGTQVGDLLISTGSGNMGSNFDGSWQLAGVSGLLWKIATSGDLSASWNFGDDTFNAIIVMFTYRGTASTPFGASARGSVSSGPYVAPSVNALATDVWLAFFILNGGSATAGSTGFTIDAIPGVYGMAHKQLSASGPTGTASFPSVGGFNGSADSITIGAAGAGGLSIKVAATAAVPAPTVSANAAVTATLVTAVAAIRNAQPSVSPALVLSVASVPLPTVVTQTNASITAALVIATAAIPDAHPPISAALVIATAAQPRPAFNATVTAIQVAGVTAVIRPAFNTTITATAVAAVSSLAGSVVSPGATTVSAVAALSRPAFNVSITASSAAAVSAISQPQSPATITAAAVLATAAVTTSRPAINVVAVTAITTISQPQSPVTITATAVPAVSVVVRPAFHVSITGLTATAATTTLTGYAAGASSTVTASVTIATAETPFATVHIYKMGAYKPNVLYTLTNLTGTFTDIQDSPDTPDANALVPTGGAIVVRMGFEDHSQAMRTHPEDQKFRVVVRVP